jgi:hypothetical protein
MPWARLARPVTDFEMNPAVRSKATSMSLERMAHPCATASRRSPEWRAGAPYSPCPRPRWRRHASGAIPRELATSQQRAGCCQIAAGAWRRGVDLAALSGMRSRFAPVARRRE